MVTEYIKITDNNMSQLDRVANALKDGCLVAFPTETVYGLGADALNPKAVLSIFTAKGRPNDNPLIVHIAQTKTLEILAMDIKPDVIKLAEAFWPGSLTMVLKKAPIVPYETTAGLDTVAVRMPDNDIALELIRRSGVPIAAPSANLSGKPSPTIAKHVVDDLNGRIPFIIDGGACRVGVESTVLDMTSETPIILRPGAVTPSMLEQVIGKVTLDKSIFGLQTVDKPRSPGMKYTHYKPKGEVVVVSGDKSDVFEWVNKKAKQDKQSGLQVVVIAAVEHLPFYSVENVIPYGSIQAPEELAASIFSIFRECDMRGVEKIYVEAIPKTGIGLAAMNRIEKAAGGKVIQL
jgi:L-threonylcarbamoyladenylate synthase